MLFFLMSLSSIAAQKSTTVKITVKDISNNQLVSLTPVIVKTTNIKTGESDATTETIDATGTFSFSLTPGNWRIELQIYDTTTEWLDYYGKRVIYIQENEPTLEKTIYLIPIGTVEGVVLDNEDKLVQGADIDFKCKFEENIDSQSTTDRFGSFKSILVPAGKCKIFAAFEEQVGMSELMVNKGQVINTTIRLTEESVLPSKPFTAVWGVIIILIFVLAIIIFSLIRRRLHNKFKEDLKKELKKVKEKEEQETKKEKDVKEEPAKEPKKQEKEELNPRARDIIETLNEREKKIVTFMLKTKESTTQAKIRNSTGIPKTSLVRCFQSLESKKVIEIEKIGKMKRIKFTEWFMGKS